MPGADSTTCSGCGAANDVGAEHCFRCGKGFFVLIEGALLAGRYEVVKPLGRGGMGMVYKAQDRELDETVAVKLLRPDVGASPEMAARFRSEIKLARRVSHRNVCRIHEYGRDASQAYIVMEFVEGEDLRKIVRDRGALPPQVAYGMGGQIADALQAIHDVGIVHRDLKTANVMVDRQGQVKLMDFGIAKSFEAESAGGATATGLIVGTPEYMSPEQARAEKVDTRSDIYSLGVILFELFSGEVPFRGDTPVATLLKHLQESPPLAGPLCEAMPPALLPILGKALAKVRDDRYSSARELHEALRQAFGSPVPSREAATWIMERGPSARTVRVSDRPTPPPAPTAADTTPLPTPPTRPKVHVGPFPPSPPVLPDTQRRAAPPPMPPPRRPEAPPAVPAPAAVPRPPRPARRASLIGWVGGGALVLASVAATLAVWMLTRDPGAGEATPSASPSAREGGLEATPVPMPSATPPAPATVTTTLVAPPTPSFRPTPMAMAPSPTPPSRRPSVAPAAPTPAPVPSRAPAVVVPPSPAPNAGVERAREAAPSAAPEPAAPAPGRLQLRVVPWAEVVVDGVSAGTTPLKPLSLSPGVHTVRLTHPGFQPLVKKVNIRSGETTLLEVDVKFEAFPKRED